MCSRRYMEVKYYNIHTSLFNKLILKIDILIIYGPWYQLNALMVDLILNIYKDDFFFFTILTNFLF